MPHYKAPDNSIHWLDSDEYENLLPAGSIHISDEELAILRAPSVAQLWANYQHQAQALLLKTDNVAIRCLKTGIAFPPEWLAYANSLRGIVRAASGDPSITLPVQPAYPAGT